MLIDVQEKLIEYFISAYSDGTQIEQMAAYSLVLARARIHGFSAKWHTEITARYDAAEMLYLVCVESGNLELLDTAREMMTVYYAVQQAMEGFSSAPENLLWARVAALA